MRRRAKTPKGKADDNRPSAGKPPKREASKVRDLEQRLAEALRREAEVLDQQTATSEILRVISSSPTDVQPVFDTIIKNAVRLCDVQEGIVLRFDGQLIHLVASETSDTEFLDTLYRVFPRAPGRDSPTARAILTRTVTHVPDILADSDYQLTSSFQNYSSRRSILSVPMLKDGEPIGAITLGRRDVRPFSDKQVALLQTFADQAVIAVENVRLFKELETRNRDLTEALDTQTATGEILRVIASSPTDLQPVLDAMAKSAALLCNAYDAGIVRLEGDVLRRVAHHGPIPPGIVISATSRGTVTGRAVLDRRPIQITDLPAETEEFPEGSALARRTGTRSLLSVPLVREGIAIGAINLRRTEVQPFTASQVALLQTFADQAVIAIENVRLFTELQQKNEALTQAHAQVTEALEQQTATSEILRVIGTSPTDAHPVFEAIARSSVRVCGALGCAVFVVDGNMVHLVGTHGIRPERVEKFRCEYPTPLASHSEFAPLLRERRIFHLADIEHNPEAKPYQIELARLGGYRTRLMVPMLRGDSTVGVIAVNREAATAFSHRQVELLRIFADQAVIAIENVRLFKELQASNRDLTTALDTQTATSEILRIISRSPTDVQPVFDAIVRSALQLLGGHAAVLLHLVGGEVRIGAYTSTHRGGDGALASRYPMPVEELARQNPPLARVLVEGLIGHVPDTEEPSVDDFARSMARARGHRSRLMVPLRRNDAVVGGLAVTRVEPGPFSEDEIALLETFADQAIIAIENMRLFNELKEANRQIEAASRHKSAFLANMSHELRTPLNAIIGYAELLEEEAGDVDGGRLVPDLQKIAVAAKHQLSLINDILDLSKIEAGRMELEVTDFDLPSAIENALTLVRERATRQGIALGRTIDDRVGVIQGDERKVKQVLLNLLSNAVKFTPEGGRIDVRATVREGLVEVSVADTGTGIALDDQAAIFEEFRQVGTVDKRVEGTGLGLALSRKFIELHGGRIWVKSQVGQGSTFTFTLPIGREG